MIKNLSPYYVTIPFVSPLSGETCTEFTMQLFVWDGAKSTPPDEPLYEFTKLNPTASVGSIDVDIANLISDSIKFTQQKGTTTELIDGNNQVWVKWQTFYNTTIETDATTPSNINTELSLKGYTYGLGGKNATTPTNKILLTGTDFKVSNNSVFVLPIEIEEAVVPVAELAITSITETTAPNYDLYWTSVGNLDVPNLRYRIVGTTIWTLTTFLDNNPQPIVLDITAGDYEFQIVAYDNDNAVLVYSNSYLMTIV